MSALPQIAEPPDAAPARGEAARLYEQHRHAVFRFCLQRLNGREEADDAVQTTFMYALMSLRRGVVPEFELAWLLKIATNVCSSRRRAASRRGRVESPHDLDAIQDRLRAPEARPANAHDLRAALGQMPESQRRAILLREWQGLTYREISDELGLSHQAVETLLFRARRTLARKLDDARAAYALDLASITSFARSLFQSSAAKTAAVAAAAAASVAAGPALEHRLVRLVDPPATHEPRAERPVGHAPAARPDGPRRLVLEARPQRIAPPSRRSAPPAPGERRRDVAPSGQATPAPSDASPTTQASSEAAASTQHEPASQPTSSPGAPTLPRPDETASSLTNALPPPLLPTPALPPLPTIQAPELPAVETPQVPAP